MSGDVTVNELAPRDYDEWNRLIAVSPEGSIYALPEYLDTLCAAGGGTFPILGARRNGELVGGVPLYERSALHGRYVTPRLLLYYTSPVLRPYETKYPSQRTARQIHTLTALAAAIEGLGYGRVTLKCRASLSDTRSFLARGWGASTSYTYVVALDDLAAAWSHVEQNLRRLITRCGEAGVTLSQDDDFDAFFDLHAATMERKDAGLYLPRPAFRTFVERLQRGGLCSLFHARNKEGRALASQLVLLGPHPVSHTVSAAAGPEALKMGASAFLRWKALETLAALGYKGNDLTDATLNPVTHFKSQLGGKLELCTVLEAPGTRRFRLGRGVEQLGERFRSGARHAVRRLLGRGTP